MAEVTQDFVLSVKKKLFEKLSNDRLRDMAEIIGQEAIELIKERTNNGIDVNSKPFRPLSKGYKKWKSRFIKGDVRKDKNMARLMSQKKGREGALRLPDYMRLTGRLMNSLRFKTVQVKHLNSIDFKIRFYLKDDGGEPANNDKAAWLKAMRRDMFFLAKSGSYKTSEYKAFSKLISTQFNKVIKSVTVK